MDRAASLPPRQHPRHAASVATRRSRSARRAPAHDIRHASPLENLESRVLLSTYYVSPSGSDSAAGGASAPWKTLQKAADNAKAGDIVHIGAGTYNAGMNLYGKAGGTASAPIQFLADPGAVLTHAATVGTNASLAGINIESTGGWYVINGFTINSDGSMQRAGIRVSTSSNVQLINNTVDHAFIGIFTSSSSNLLLQGNTCRNSTDQHGIYVGAGMSNAVVRGNTMYGNNWDGLHMNASNAVGPNTGALIEDNVIYGNNLAGMDIEGLDHAIFRNNVIYNNTKHGITVHSQDQTANGDPTPASISNTFVNNTITGNGMFGILFQKEDMADTVVFNNVLVANSSYAAIGTGSAPTGLTSDYNIVSDSFSTNLGTSKMTLAQWRSSTGQDTHSIVASASQLFVNASGNDFHLKAGAPAIDKGVASLAGRAAASDDFSQSPRPQGAGYDIGAFEFNSTPDTTAPVISGVTNSTPTSTTATINWTTDEAADSQVEYGTTTAYGSTTTLNTTLSASHAVALSGLAANTTYHFHVLSRDAAGNLASSADFTFTTATPDTTAPVISAVNSANLTATGATLTWTTDESADTQVEYGLTTAYGSSSTLNTTLATAHSVALSGLTASTTYHFRVKSKDASGNLAVSGDFTFTTAAPPSFIFSPVPVLGDMANYTAVTPSRWSVTNDGGDARLYLNTSSYTELSGDRLGEYALAGPASYGDFDLSARARTAENITTNPMADYALVFGFKDANNYDYVMFNAGVGATQLFAVVGGTRQLVATATAVGLPDTAYHNVAVSRRGQAVTVSLDGQAILAASGASIASAGRVGVGSFNDAAYFDDINVSPVPPTVLSAAYDDTTAIHTLTVQFSEDVTGLLTPGAFALQNMTTAAGVDPATLTAAYDAATHTLTITPVTGQFPTGDYLLQLNASAIRDADGNALDGDANGTGGDNYQFTFYHLDGDANHDGAVNFADLLALSRNYNMTGGATVAEGDFNYDGVVNYDDLLTLARNYNTVSSLAGSSTPAPAAAPASAPVLSAAPVVAAATPAPTATSSTTTTTSRTSKTATPKHAPTSKPAPTARAAKPRSSIFTNRKIAV